MSRHGNSPGPLPDRWLHCPRKADQLILEKFLAFKTPLSSRFNNEVSLEYRFTPNMLFDYCRMKKLQLGLWIDLTNTKRFYDKEEIEAQGCQYVKLQCRGHGECPSPEVTKVFVDLVHKFISKNPLKIIGVHCTHGFNRTGLLIAAYLIEKMDLSVEAALEKFAEARPPGIYKGDYIEELFKRYGDIEDVIPPPDRPNWESEEYAGTGQKINDSSSNSSSGPSFMEGVPGVTAITDKSKILQLQKKVQGMCGWKKKGFPGCQPVTMDTQKIHFLRKKPYMVSWKADGMRYLMLIDGYNEVYFFDRDNNVFQVSNLTFPYRKNLKQHLKDTLLDGEMVIDKVDGVSIPRYLVYDIVQFLKQEVGKTSFASVRLICLQKEIIEPRMTALEQGLINRADEPFSIRKKDFWPIEQAGNLLGPRFAATLAHEPDGLIFQPAHDPYVAGRCDYVLKWKPLELNSVDFRIKIVKEVKEGCLPRKIVHLYVGSQKDAFDQMKYTKELKDLDGKIIECKYDTNKWVFMRERTDKSYPNGLETANSVINSIKAPLTETDLLNYIKDLQQYNHDSKMMPPPSKKVKR